MTAYSLLPLAMLGGIVGLDVVSFPQAMFSRPVVAATLAGAIAGDPLRGLLAGVILEMLAMELLPVGASRYPEWGSASVVGGAIAAAFPWSSGELVLGVLAALITAWAGGWSMHALRRLNVVWSVAARERLDGGDTRLVSALQLRGLASDFFRAALLTGGALAVAAPAVAKLATLCVPTAGLALGTLTALGSAVVASAVWRLAPPSPRVRLLALAALAAGATLAVIE